MKYSAKDIEIGMSFITISKKNSSYSAAFGDTLLAFETGNPPLMGGDTNIPEGYTLIVTRKPYRDEGIRMIDFTVERNGQNLSSYWGNFKAFTSPTTAKLSESRHTIRKIIREALDNDTYFETLSATLDSVREKAAKLGYEVSEDDIFSQFGTGGVSYGQTASGNIELLNDGNPILGKSGKPMNRSLHVSIYRMDSGKYELTSYKTW